jgi:hypothetical protein
MIGAGKDRQKDQFMKLRNGFFYFSLSFFFCIRMKIVPFIVEIRKKSNPNQPESSPFSLRLAHSQPARGTAYPPVPGQGNSGLVQA